MTPDPGAIFPMECRVCHRLVRPGRPGWARIMIVCAECSPRRGQLAKERSVVPDLIDPAVRCTRCAELGATVSGLCLNCVAREIAEELDRILRSVIGPDTEPEPATLDLFEREAEP